MKNSCWGMLGALWMAYNGHGPFGMDLKSMHEKWKGLGLKREAQCDVNDPTLWYVVGGESLAGLLGEFREPDGLIEQLRVVRSRARGYLFWSWEALSSFSEHSVSLM